MLVRLRLITAAVLTLAFAACAAPALAQDRPRVLVLTDIGNEPDDAESLVRFLVYANEFDIEGLVATTSRHQRDTVRRDLIDERLAAYGKVLPNLSVHAKGYPSLKYLQDRTFVGRPGFGMIGVGDGKDTAGSDWIIRTVDADDPRPVWVLVWGGAVDLAQALHKVRATRTPEQVDAFVKKLRVYSISDQDDAGPWIRNQFRDIWWIVSLHAVRQYALSTWSGISGEGMYMFDRGGPNSTIVSNEWLQLHVQVGPLGELYPPWKFIMEGDTPSFLHLIPNGLTVPEQPAYGGWGGRYERVSAWDNIYTDTTDTVAGPDGQRFRSGQATIWRWREAYQNDFAARMQWTLKRRYADANHTPMLTLNGAGGRSPVVIEGVTGQIVTLDATGSSDPDGNGLAYRWFQYREAGSVNPAVELTLKPDGPTRVSVVLPKVKESTSFHIILEVKDDGVLPLFAYRRAIINVTPLATS